MLARKDAYILLIGTTGGGGELVLAVVTHRPYRVLIGPFFDQKYNCGQFDLVKVKGNFDFSPVWLVASLLTLAEPTSGSPCLSVTETMMAAGKRQHTQADKGQDRRRGVVGRH